MRSLARLRKRSRRRKLWWRKIIVLKRSRRSLLRLERPKQVKALPKGRVLIPKRVLSRVQRKRFAWVYQTRKQRLQLKRFGNNKSLKARDLAIYGRRMRTLYPSGSVYFYDAVMKRSVVTVGPMISGNRKSPNSWNYTVREDDPWYGSMDEYYMSNLYASYRGFWGGEDALYAPVWDRTSIYNRALNRLNDRVRGNLDLAVDIAEGRQTVRMVGDAIKKLNAARHALRKGITDVVKLAESGQWKIPTEIRSSNTRSSLLSSGGKHVARRSRELANGLLEFRYGWQPLMSSVFNAADELVHTALSGATVYSAKVNQVIKVDFSRPVTYPITTTSRVVGTGKQSCKFRLTMDIAGGIDLARWASLNPVSLLWELTPYSFVADWFFDVGSWLRNLETYALYNAKFISGYSSELYAYDGSETIDSGKSYSAGGSLYVIREPLTALVRRRQFYRTKLTSYPLPRKPSIELDLSSARMLSAAALLRQLLKR